MALNRPKMWVRDPLRSSGAQSGALAPIGTANRVHVVKLTTPQEARRQRAAAEEVDFMHRAAEGLLCVPELLHSYRMTGHTPDYVGITVIEPKARDSTWRRSCSSSCGVGASIEGAATQTIER